MKKKTVIPVLLLVIGLVLITTGATLAFFNYSGIGQKTNTLRVGSITFHYDEIDGMGRGIQIEDAIPVESNDIAKTSNKAFNFNIKANTGGDLGVQYTVTARIDNLSRGVIGDIVDVYVTEVNGNSETPTALFTETIPKYNQLSQYSEIDVNDYVEKVILTDTATGTYNKNFRLRMWIDANADFSGRVVTPEGCSNSEYTSKATCVKNGATWTDEVRVYPYNNKQFKVKINVYAEGKMTNQADNITTTSGKSLQQALDDIASEVE